MFEIEIEIDLTIRAGLLARIMDLWPDAEMELTSAGFKCYPEIEENIHDELGRLEALLSRFEKDRDLEDRMSLSVEKVDDYFKGEEIINSGRFIIHRPDVDVSPAPGRTCLAVDPGRAFGTGAHPSSALMLACIEEFYSPKAGHPDVDQVNVLDAGTGTGILAMAAATLSSGQITATDVSPASIEAAQKNITGNNLAGRIQVSDTNVQKVEGEFGLIMANLNPSVLAKTRIKLMSLLTAEGTLLMSGFTDEQAPAIVKAITRAGAYMQKSYSKDGWMAMSLVRQT